MFRGCVRNKVIWVVLGQTDCLHSLLFCILMLLVFGDVGNAGPSLAHHSVLLCLLPQASGMSMNGELISHAESLVQPRASQAPCCLEKCCLTHAVPELNLKNSSSHSFCSTQATWFMAPVFSRCFWNSCDLHWGGQGAFVYTPSATFSYMWLCDFRYLLCPQSWPTQICYHIRPSLA